MAEEKNQEQNLSQLLQIRRDKLKELQEGGRDPFQITKYEVTHDSAAIKADFDAMEGSQVSLAGRLMSKRGMGKVSFCDLQDKSGRIQLYARRDEMDEEEYDRFKKLDIGDIVGVKGMVFRTQRGEMSVRVEAVTLLSKSLLPLPEKFHGLTNTELRYRQRYVDLIVNPEVKRNFMHPLPVHQACAGLPGRPGLYGGGDPRPEHHLRRRHCPSLHHPPQHAGHRHVSCASPPSCP